MNEKFGVIKVEKYLLAIIAMIMLLMTSCDQVKEVLTDSEETFEEIGLPIEDNANELPFITDEDYLDERTMLERGLEQQRELYKLGFLTNDFNNAGTYIVYYPLDKTFGYSSMYRIPNSHVSFKFEAGTSFEASLYHAMIDQFVNPKEITIDTLQLTYGKYLHESNGEYYVMTKDEETTYLVQAGSETEGYTEEIVQYLGESLQTEEDGAYDPFYQYFSLDIDKLRFPTVNDRRVAIHDASVSVVGVDEQSQVSITYMLSELDSIVYRIGDTEPSLNEEYAVKDELTITDGISVTEYEHEENKSHHFFHWMDDSYHYTMEVKLDNEDIIKTAEIHDMIESAIQDGRSFENPALFQPLNEMPNQTKDEKNFINLLENMHKDSK